MIIDFHTHIFSPVIRENRSRYTKMDPCFSTLYSNPKATLSNAEELIDSMDQYGIDMSVILNIGWSDHTLCVETNNYIIESVSRYPDRLIGFCAVQPLAGKAAIEEIQRCAREGIKGIGELRSDMQGFEFDDDTIMGPIVEAAQQYNLMLLTHSSEPVGHTYNGKGTISPEVMYRFLEKFRSVPTICAHWGGGLPFYFLMPEVSKSLNNTYFDTAASFFLYNNDIFSIVAQIAGIDKILFGSDYPLIEQHRYINLVRSLDWTEENKQAVLGGNAAKLLGIQ